MTDEFNIDIEMDSVGVLQIYPRNEQSKSFVACYQYQIVQIIERYKNQKCTPFLIEHMKAEIVEKIKNWNNGASI